MEEHQEKMAVLNCLAAGNYEVCYEPVDSIGRCVKYDGSVFYVSYDLDDARSSTDLGAFTFRADDHEFVYDMNDGTWSGDELCEDGEVVAALQHLKEFVDVDDYDGDRQWEIYAQVNGVERGAAHYWCEDDNCPKDVDEYGYEEVEVPMEYRGVKPNGGAATMEARMTDADLYFLYRLMRRTGKLKQGTLSGKDVAKTYPELYQHLLSQVQEQAKENQHLADGAVLQFSLLLSPAFFEEKL